MPMRPVILCKDKNLLRQRMQSEARDAHWAPSSLAPQTIDVRNDLINLGVR